MPDTGWLDLNTFASVDSQSSSWSNPSNAASSDNSDATISLSLSATSNDHLRGTNLDATGIGADDDIDGIEVRMELASDAFFGIVYNSINNVQIVNGGSRAGTAKTPAQSLTTSDTYYTYGGASDMWGLGSLKGSDVNASDFGFDTRLTNSSSIGTGAYCDHLQMKIYYTESAGGSVFIPKVIIY